MLAVVSAAGFGVYYFGFVRPRRAQLEETKTSSIEEISSTLGEYDSSAAGEYKTRVRSAGSQDEVSTIMSEMYDAYEVEKKKEELLQLAKDLTQGTLEESLESLYNDFKSQINAEDTLSGLNDLEQEMESTAESEWRQVHLSQIESIAGADKIVMRKRNTPIFWKDGLAENDARAIVNDSSWEELRKMKFEESGSYAIPIMDTYGRAPTVEEGSIVDVGLYNRENENLEIIGEDSIVEKVIYTKDMGAISWSESEGGTSNNYSTDLWEEIKALEANIGAASDLDGWAADVIAEANNNNIGDFQLEAIYVVNVPAQGDAKIVSKFQNYKEETHDIVILPQIEEGE